MKLLTGAILSAANETIPRGRRRHYIPGRNAQLKELHSTASRLREKKESRPTDESVAAYKKAKAEFTRQKLQQTRAAWSEKKNRLPSSWKKLWKLTKLLNGEIPEEKHRWFYSQRENLLFKRKQPAAWQNCTKKRAMSSYQGKEPVKSESS